VTMRWITLGLGLWLVVSTLVLPDTTASRANVAVTGALIAFTSLWALRAPPARFINTMLATWLFFSTLFVDHVDKAAAWNDLLVASAVFVLSLWPLAEPMPAQPAHA